MCTRNHYIAAQDNSMDCVLVTEFLNSFAVSFWLCVLLGSLPHAYMKCMPHTFNFVMSNEAKGVKELLTDQMLGIKMKMHVMCNLSHTNV